LVPTAWFVGLAVWFVNRESKIRSGLREWHEVPARVLEIQPRTRKGGELGWDVRYAYEVEGNSYEHTDTISPGEQDAFDPPLQGGVPLQVVVLPDDPAWVWLPFRARERMQNTDQGMGVGDCCVLVPLGATLLAWLGAYVPLLRQRSLVRRGLPTP